MQLLSLSLHKTRLLSRRLVLQAMPGVVQEAMDKVGALVGRHYKLFDYVGHPEVGAAQGNVFKSGGWELFRLPALRACAQASPAALRSGSTPPRNRPTLPHPLHCRLSTCWWPWAAALRLWSPLCRSW